MVSYRDILASPKMTDPEGSNIIKGGGGETDKNKVDKPEHHWVRH